MQVRVRNHYAEESTWGRGGSGLVVQTVTIADTCPVCGGPRGQARTLRFCCDGDWYEVDTWDNPCGHVDTYDRVIQEVQRTRPAIDATLPSHLLV